MQFPSTLWSQLAVATLHGDENAAQALEAFCHRYRHAVISFMRWRHVKEDRIEDLAHDFFLQLMTHSALRRADRQRGRFRAYLTASLMRFLSDDARYNTAQKRGGGDWAISLEQAQMDQEEPTIPPDDQAVMDREWGVAVYQLALEKVRAEYIAQGKEDRFNALRGFLPGASADPAEANAQSSASALSLSVEAIRTELYRLRERFRECLRIEIAQTVDSAAEIDEEMAYLRHVLTTRSIKPVE
jgi:DNA-directed RNA polymerase specialized sigma24 family protein